MSKEAINASRAAFEQFSRGDFSAFADLPDEFELVLAPEMPDAGTYRGAAAREWATAWVNSFDRLTQEPIEFIDARRTRGNVLSLVAEAVVVGFDASLKGEGLIIRQGDAVV